MRSIIRRSLVGLAILIPVALIAGCQATDSPAPTPSAESVVADDDPMKMYFRDEDLEALSQPRLAVYPAIEPGDSDVLYHGFEGCPPQIPHSVEDMLPLSPDDHACLECHHPDNADVEAGDVPLPESHFMNPKMSEGGEGDAMRLFVAGYETGTEMSGARWDCTLCHAPQANNVDTQQNSFGE